ncbi:hypothetical protein VPH35_084129 [Triticum aestivum]
MGHLSTISLESFGERREYNRAGSCSWPLWHATGGEGAVLPGLPPLLRLKTTGRSSTSIPSSQTRYPRSRESSSGTSRRGRGGWRRLVRQRCWTTRGSSG